MVLIFLVAAIWSSSEAASYRTPEYVPRLIRLLLSVSSSTYQSRSHVLAAYSTRRPQVHHLKHDMEALR